MESCINPIFAQVFFVVIKSVMGFSVGHDSLVKDIVDFESGIFEVPYFWELFCKYSTQIFLD